MNNKADPLPVLAIGDCVLDESNARLTCNGVPLDVPPKAFSVLCHLARNVQRLVTKDDLLDAVWGHRHVSESVLKTTINLLPRISLTIPVLLLIETANRRGYRFVAAWRQSGCPARSLIDSAWRSNLPAVHTDILAVDDEPELLSISYYLVPGLSCADCSEHARCSFNPRDTTSHWYCSTSR